MFFNGRNARAVSIRCYFLLCFILSLSKIHVDARYFFVNSWKVVDHRTPADIMVDVTNNIGLLVLECHNIQNRNNIAFSPYGLTSVLIALYEGVTGEAAIQIHRTARFPFEKDVIRVGFRDIHRLLRSYFLPKEGFLAGLSLNNENITLTPEYKAILQFYGYDLNPNFTTTQSPITSTVSSTSMMSSTESSVQQTSTLTSPESTKAVDMTQTNAMTDSTTITQPQETSESTVVQTSTTEAEITTSMVNQEQTTTSEASVSTESMTESMSSTETMASETSAEQPAATSPSTTNIPEETTQTESPMESPEPQTTTPAETSTANVMTDQPSTSTTENPPTPETPEQSTNENASPETLESEGPVDKTESASVETTSDSSSNEIETFSQENLPSTDGSSTMDLMTSDISTVQMNSESTTSPNTPDADSTLSSEITTSIEDQSATSTNSATVTTVTTSTEIDTTITTVEAETPETEGPRKKRSLADFIIARYYDGPFAFREPPLTTTIPLRQKHQYPFLVNGIQEQYNVNYTEYDAVLPFNYLAQVQAVALRLPLDSDKYYLLIVLPLNPQGINNLICDIRKYETIRSIVGGLKDTYVRAVIPSFMLKGFVILTSTLQRLGIRNVFEPGHADFSPMTTEEDIYVTNIEQAVTVTIRNYKEPTITKKRHYNYRPVEFKVTHPFMYFIIDSTLDVALMAGKIVNPLNLRIQ